VQPSGGENEVVSPTPAGVMIVDDQAPFRRAAHMVIGAMSGFEIVGEAESGEDAVELFESLAPSLVLMDINLPGINGIEATRRITTAHPDAKVLLLSTYQASDLPSGTDTCGAVGYVNKEEFGPAVVLDIWKKHVEA
jgi:two-component system invasion response regulator UvrY